jgi:hypothetical protein
MRVNRFDGLGKVYLKQRERRQIDASSPAARQSLKERLFKFTSANLNKKKTTYESNRPGNTQRL